MLKNKSFLIIGLIISIGSLLVLLALFWGQDRFNASEVANGLTHEEFMNEQKKIAELFKEEGLKSAFDYTQNQINNDASFAMDCHPLMHSLGHLAYKKYGSFQKAQHPGGEICNSGYIHGLIQEEFKDVKDEQLEGKVANTCNEEVRYFDSWQCYHGIGHGVMYATDRDLTKSLTSCEYINKNEWVMACINGVFMEYFIIIDHSGHNDVNRSKTVSINDCRVQKDEAKNDCYFYAPTANLSLNPGGYEETVKQCEQIEEKYEAACVAGVGAQLMKDNITNPSLASKFCKSQSTEMRNPCVIGAIDLYTLSLANTSKAMVLCSQEFSQFEQICIDSVKSIAETHGI